LVEQIRAEVLRYLGYRGQQIPDEIAYIIDECIREIGEISRPRHVYRTWKLERQHDELSIITAGRLVLPGKAIKRHLRLSNEVIGIAFTLGVDVDRQIRKYQLTDLTRATILNACGAAYIEEYADQICSEIAAEVPGTHLTPRFSPGYGDFPLSFQRSLLTALDSERTIGLVLTDHLLMIPRKSVSALIGRQRLACAPEEHCSKCDQVDCDYRRVK